ncbi:MAG TPA: holo-ACP synthase [Bacillota bacterium]|nr:holo-ACP synthase [Bacillota bacterium]
MIKGIGLDMIELDRIDKSLQKDNRLVKRVLTEREQALFQRLATHRRKVEFLAGRFAAKEAFSKAAGTGIGTLSFQHIDVMPSESGAPHIQAIGYEHMRIFVSITHSDTYAVAQIVLEDV